MTIEATPVTERTIHDNVGTPLPPPVQIPADLADQIGAPDHFDYALIEALIAWAEQDLDRLVNPKVDWKQRFIGSWNQAWWGGTTRTPKTEEEAKDLLTGVCGTSFCMAGQAVLQKGYRLEYRWSDADKEDAISNLSFIDASAEDCVKTEPTGRRDKRGRQILRDVGEPRDIEATATLELGLSSEEGGLFFDGGNGVHELKCYANEMCARRHLPLMFPGEGWTEEDEG